MRVELPPEPVYFVNRDDERERALRAVGEWRSRSRPLVLAVSGAGGLGKTELAGLIARTLLDQHSFPDGALSVDLDDFRADGVLDPGDVLTQLLGSLDVAQDQVQRSYAARCRQYWNRTSGAKLVLLLDNARYASEVVPLLPASGVSVVIVTSHGPLHDLEAGAAVDLALAPLEERAATELLELIVRDHRLAADPEAVRSVVRLCDGLPAALHVAGRWVRTHRLRPLARVVSDLRAELDEKGVSGVEHVWDMAYEDLSRPTALLYRLLPHHPGETFTLHSATALSGLDPEACQDALEELDRAGLLDLRLLALTVAGQMRLPGPQRGHALRRSRRETSDGEVAEAQVRLVRWLVRQAQLADRYAAGRRLTVVPILDSLPGVPDGPLEDPEAAEDAASRAARAERAARWLDEERHVLFACSRLAHARGMDTETVALSEPVWTHALDHPHQSEVVEVLRRAVDSAVRYGGNAGWLVRTRCQLARPLWESEELAAAQEQIDGAMSALELLGDSERDRKLAASAVEHRGMLKGARGEWSSALADFAGARDLHRAIPNPYGVLLQTYRMGEASAKTGDLDAARLLLSEAYAGFVAQGRERLIGRSAFALAGVLHRLGRADDARELYEQSLGRADRRRSGFDAARVHDALAELDAGDGHLAEAEEHRVAARALRQRNGLL
ncbi:NB-ARC domain-containing protein [Streptomyces antibioticus]|uniref:NB-ARC domain-containing protein n=1 Tax=Streptomyces antibioticus TaxID=1890 RepID=UPI00225331E3|nr:NB-ARC domain-containing protein [Streptomyces antibioticus]MCX5170588.1 NB-ARC domain-containing protein [Streptomyces antibioticus]